MYRALQLSDFVCQSCEMPYNVWTYDFEVVKTYLICIITRYCALVYYQLVIIALALTKTPTKLAL